MPITIAGSGTITGLSAGGLPDGVITTDDIAASAITRAKIGYSGAVLQFVSAEYTTASTLTATIPFDNTIPQNNEGTEIFSLSITPTSASSRLVISFDFPMADTSGVTVQVFALFQDSGANALNVFTNVNSSNDHCKAVCFTHVMTAGTTSSTTFKLRVGPNAGNMYLNRRNDGIYFGGVMKSFMTITEVAS
jgi:hypothetical protein